MNNPHVQWMVTGATGQLGGNVLRALTARNVDESVCALTRAPHPQWPGVEWLRGDLGNLDGLAATLHEAKPTHIIHLAAVTAVGDAYRDPDRAQRINVDATCVLIEYAKKQDARVAFASTDMVFDGEHAPYREDHSPQPLSAYGRTKVAAEEVVRAYDGGIVVRLPLMYGFPTIARDTTFIKQVAALRAGEPLRLFTDEYRTPIALCDAARAMIALAESDRRGTIHVAGPQRLSRYAMGECFAEALGIEKPNLVAISRNDIDAAEPRAADLSLDGGEFKNAFGDFAPGPITRERLGEPPA